MNKYTFVFLTVLATGLIAGTSGISNAFSSTTDSVSYCPPICLDEIQQHVNDARDALNDGKLIEAASELDIVSSLLDQLDDMTSKSN